MKILVEPLGNTVTVEELVQNKVAQIPKNTSQEIKDVVNWLAERATDQYIETMRLQQENAKLRCMWGLRHLEDEINSEKGQLIITENSTLKIKNFSDSLAQKIRNVAERGYKG